MDPLTTYEMMLDNLTDGAYLLDDKGNYIFVNSTYIQYLNMPKKTLLNYNVHDFLATGQIDYCISDIVYREKRRVVMYQDVYDTQQFGRRTIRQLVISTPIFNESGEIQNIFAIARPLDSLNDLFDEASKADVVSTVMLDIENRDTSIIAESVAMKNILVISQQIADVDSAILISGESGTGKEVVAQYIHEIGDRRDKPFVVINCASLPESLLESELFGYEKGAFTGASGTGKKGLFEAAAGGILFLDEINSLPLNLQGKLLRAIETKTITRIGSTKPIAVDFRLLAATNEDLALLIEEKRFRADLYYRLNVIPIDIPPLRERQADIIPLANHFLKVFCAKHGKNKVFSQHTLETIRRFDWPGNVRQLKNFVERSVIISLGEVIEMGNIGGVSGTGQKTHPTAVQDFGALQHFNAGENTFSQLLDRNVSLEEYVAQCERNYLRFALQKYPNSYKAADILGTSQTSIIRKKKKHGL